MSNKKSSFNPKHDPYAQREAQKYVNPIPSRELIIELLTDHGKPLTQKAIQKAFTLFEEEQVEALRRRLRAMERDGQVLKNRKQCFCLVNSKDLIVGRVIGHSEGFGFLRPDDATEDLYFSPREMKALMHNDRVVAQIITIDRRGRREGSVVDILERLTARVVGRIILDKGVAFVIPNNKKINQDIIIPQVEINGALHEQIVVAELIEQPTKRNKPIGKVVEIMGDHMAPGMEIEVALRSYELPFIWPDLVLDEINDLKSEVPEAAKTNRIDLRNTPLITIDGEDARDFDDAVYCERVGSAWKLIVAIADVSFYVTPDSALDTEARNRGTSVYFPEQVIPMLPEALSNGLCSINPEVDRLCLVCEMMVSDQGVVTETNFYEAVMRSHARMTYTEVAGIIKDNTPELLEKYHDRLDNLADLHQLFTVLSQIREQRGAMDFDTRETQIIFAENRKIEQIIPTTRNDAHRMIEEFMIAANISAARFLQKHKMPKLLRVHEGPSAEKVLDLRVFLNELGLSLDGGLKPEPKDYMALMDQVKGRADSHLIQTVILRSLSQAVYSAEDKGHFGLALEAYGHFTSPIRRYPDLLIHRAIKHVCLGLPPEAFRYSFQDMVNFGEHCSATERRADEATREVVSWLKCEYMMDKIGQGFSGIISSVTAFGLFIELEDLYIEGLVHISTLGKDFYHFDAVSHQLTGEQTGKKYRLGDAINVVLARVDLDEKKIDFDLPQKSSKTKKLRADKKVRKIKKNKKIKKRPQH
jgi:ribonuclease R